MNQKGFGVAFGEKAEVAGRDIGAASCALLAHRVLVVSCRHLRHRRRRHHHYSRWGLYVH